MALSVLNGPMIKAGESLSDGLDCTSGSIVRLTMPPQWTPANLTFQISSDGTFFNDLVTMDGEDIVLTVVPGSAVVVAPLSDYLKAVAYLKVRSGTREHPIPQEGDRAFAVAVEIP
ncbi:MAG: hypothetical protein J2P55_01355 [Rhizobiales bacterium]|nr:hypothetical protein [Hyphomicrobiales bacterium]